MGAGHNHGGGDARVRRMLIAAAILTGFFIVELTTALLINSIALLADAGHMLTDLVAMFMGLTAVLLARHGSASPARTYGWHRAEVFTAVANAALLIGVAAFILFEAVERFGDAPDVPGVPMIVVALAGLLANAVVVLLLRSHSKDSLAVKGAYMEVVADTVGSIGVLIAGIVTVTTHWPYADVVVAVLSSLVLVYTHPWSPCGYCPARSRSLGRRCASCPSPRPPTSTSRSYGPPCARSTASPRYTTYMSGHWCRARTWSPRT